MKTRKERSNISKIIENAKEEYDKLQQMLNFIERDLKDAPEGCLIFNQKANAAYPYHQYYDSENRKHIRTYINKSNLDFARALAQKGYLIDVKTILEKNKKALENLLNEYDEESIDLSYEMLDNSRKSLVNPVRISVKEQVRRWDSETYELCSIYPENLKFETDKGEMVRSKSEVIIANLLNQNRKHILYKYERPLEVMVVGKAYTIYPDFTIINLHTGKIYYWEHAGRMDDPKYADDFVRKMHTYINNGLYPGEDVIISYETMNYPLNIHNINLLIKQII